jgi:hypothetical protein
VLDAPRGIGGAMVRPAENGVSDMAIEFNPKETYSARLVPWQSKDKTKEGLSYVPGSDKAVDALIEASGKLNEQMTAIKEEIADRIGFAVTDDKGKPSPMPSGALKVPFTKWKELNVFEATERKSKKDATRQTVSVGDAFRKKAAA